MKLLFYILFHASFILNVIMGVIWEVIKWKRKYGYRHDWETLLILRHVVYTWIDKYMSLCLVRLYLSYCSVHTFIFILMDHWYKIWKENSFLLKENSNFGPGSNLNGFIYLKREDDFHWKEKVLSEEYMDFASSREFHLLACHCERSANR